MTINRIIIELKNRQNQLIEQKKRLNNQCSALIHKEPFCDKSIEEIDHVPELYRALMKKEEPYREKIRNINAELSIISDMLYAYEQSSYKV